MRLTLTISALLLPAALFAADGTTGKMTDEYVKVEVKGTLRTGIAAIGAETTGTLIEAKGVRWELDFRGNEQLRRRAQALDGKRVVVTGTLESRAGVEVRRRTIVTVTSLKEAPAR